MIVSMNGHPASVETRRTLDGQTWYIVAQVPGLIVAEIVAESLHSAGIPVRVFREAAGTALPVSVGLLGSVKVGVPGDRYEDAVRLLDAGSDLSGWNEEDDAGDYAI